VAPADVEAATASLEAIWRELEAAAALRSAFDLRLSEARALLASLRSALDEGAAAHREAVMKISVPSGPPPLELDDDLVAGVDQFEALAQTGRWREAGDALDRWTRDARMALDDAERVLRANRAPIEARNQLRALLEAYQVKASRLGAVEDPQLADIFDRAQEALYTAPTDLAAAAQLVRHYQEILNAPHRTANAAHPTAEVLR
jgi:hypothetical protein